MVELHNSALAAILFEVESNNSDCRDLACLMHYVQEKIKHFHRIIGIFPNSSDMFSFVLAMLAFSLLTFFRGLTTQHSYRRTDCLPCVCESDIGFSCELFLCFFAYLFEGYGLKWYDCDLASWVKSTTFRKEVTCA